MIIKDAAGRERDLRALEEIKSDPRLSEELKARVESERRNILAGQRGEKDAAYHLDFHYGRSENWAVIHDLRVECRGRIAQIDHLVMSRLLEVYVVETKHFAEGIAVNASGECTTFWKGTARGIPSPHEQNARHIAVLKDVFEGGSLSLPTRAGFNLMPTLRSLVVVSPSARITRPKARGWWSDGLVKADQLPAVMAKSAEASSPFALAKVISSETLKLLARDIARLHTPIEVDWRARFGVDVQAASPGAPSAATDSQSSARKGRSGAPKCETCGADVETKVVHFCRFNKARFAGKTICKACQPSFPTK